MAKKPKHTTNVTRVWIFISQTAHVHVDIQGEKVWISTGPVVHGAHIPYSGLQYNYDPKLHRLTVFDQKGLKIFDRTCYYGAAFEIVNPNKGNRRSIHMLRYPHAKEKAVPWLCGFFSPDSRTDSFKAYEKAIWRRKCRNSENLLVKRAKNARFAYAWTDAGYRPAICYVKRLDERTARQILRDFQVSHFPSEFIEKVLDSTFAPQVA